MHTDGTHTTAAVRHREVRGEPRGGDVMIQQPSDRHTADMAGTARSAGTCAGIGVAGLGGAARRRA